MSFRTYLIIGVIVAVVLYILDLLIGDAMIGFIENFRVQAISAGMAPVIADTIAQPLKLIFSQDLIGALVAGALWPFAGIWLLLLIVLVVYGAIVPGINAAGQPIS